MGSTQGASLRGLASLVGVRLVVLSLGCGGDDRSPGVGDDLARYARAVCERGVECATLSPSIMEVARCEEHVMRRLCLVRERALTDLDACVASLAAAECSLINAGATEGSSACDGVRKQLRSSDRQALPLGEPCDPRLDFCGDSATCAWDANGVCGVCTLRALEGEVCSARVPCQLGLVCGADLRRCVRPREAGAACTLDHECAGACVAGVCSQVESGAPCDQDAICPTGLLCEAGRCNVPRLAACGSTAAPCAVDVDCAAGLVCSRPERVCLRPSLGYDAPCGSGGAGCEAGLSCQRRDFGDYGTQTCLPPQPDGSDCFDDTDCASGVCSRSVHRCAPARACRAP